MNEPGTIDEAFGRRHSPVFISYASADRKKALSVCNAVERRGIKCWMSARDVAVGENYQDAIVHSLRRACAVVLVFSQAANSSEEIKKELSLASRYRIPVMALRIEDAEPTDGFAYELSTRQWIDAFDSWEQSIDSLVIRLQQVREPGAKESPAAAAPRRPFSSNSRRAFTAAAAAALLLVVAGGWWMLRPPHPVHSMTVRLADFQVLSADLPTTMRDAVGAEITAAFNADGVIGVSTAATPPAGVAPAYALGGTIHRVGDSIRVITQFSNERTGAVLWSDSVDYAADQVSKVPHKVAVDVGTIVRCGLFGASTYHKPLPDQVLSNYMRYCRGYWAFEGSQTLHFAQMVVAAVPDFSFGWSAVANGFLQSSQLEPDDRRAEELRAAGRQAEDKALALDAANSEALAHTAYLIDPHDWARQEALFKSAVAAKPLDCGCEHFGYGLTLERVGRVRDAVEQYRAATDMLALWPDSQLALGNALVMTGRVDQAKPHFDSAIDLTTDSTLDKWIASTQGTETGDYAGAIAALRNPELQIAAETRAALLSGYQALASGNPQTKAKAVPALLALPQDQQNDRVATMLASLGANHEALKVASGRPWLLWRRSMRGVLDEPDFPAVANQLGLMRYWKTSHNIPDVCRSEDQPAFCRMI